MKPKKKREFRAERASELRVLAEILEKAQLVSDVQPLHTAATQCVIDKAPDDPLWTYDLVGLEFNFEDNLRHTRPKGAELISVGLDVFLEGICLDSDSVADPFERLAVSIVIDGLSKNGELLKAAWHLEKHKSAESLFDHPKYHFHCGGKKIWESEDALQGFGYGSLLLLESPRLDHKPLDGILAVNFVLANFAGKAWQALKVENPSYNDLIQEAEKRCHLAYTQAALDYLKRR